MMIINEQKINEQLKGFDAVWRRVKSSKKNVRHSAEECGLKFMPKNKGQKPRGK